MKAIILQEFGTPENLLIKEIPQPVLGYGEVLVKVKAVSINPVDVKTRAGGGLAGLLKDQMPIILGWDLSGIVVEVGYGVNGFVVSDEVFGMVNFPGLGGAYAEYVAVPANHLAKKPRYVTHEIAAVSSLAALTVYQAFFHEVGLQPGQRVLIHAAAGGVGHFAVQIAKHFGAYVLGTSSAENKDFVLSLGADEHIDYKNSDFRSAANHVDLVLDMIGGDTLERSLDIVNEGGSVITLPSHIDRRLSDKASKKGIKADFFLVESNGGDMKKVAELLGNGIIKAHISKHYAFDDMAAAHHQIESANTKGKVVLSF